jgi:cytidyltransferase-like protein
MKIVIVSGGFDPIHSGHIEYFNAAKKLGDYLIVGVNSDEWLKRKKGREFLSIAERKLIISNLKMVDEVISFDDTDGSACDAIKYILESRPEDDIIFVNGGDRINANTPEYSVYYNNPRVSFKWEVGGSNKINSSSWILDNWKTNRTNRDWGYWRVLDDKKTIKVKELVIYPHKSLSDQYHNHRNEHWYIIKGECNIDVGEDEIKTVTLSENDTLIIPSKSWHKAYNTTDEPCHVLEIQYGDRCEEDDIIRRN